MSEASAEIDAAQDQTPEDAPEIDWKAKSREWERRAKANKAAADRLAELEEAQKTAEQKSAERLAEAERKAAELEAKAVRAEVAAATGVPVDILAGPDGVTAEAVAAFADKIKTFTADGRSRGNVVPMEGVTPDLGRVNPWSEVFRELDARR